MNGKIHTAIPVNGRGAGWFRPLLGLIVERDLPVVAGPGETEAIVKSPENTGRAVTGTSA